MSKEGEDPLSPPEGADPLNPPEGADPLNPPAGGGVNGEEVDAISRSFNRYQPFGKPKTALQQGNNIIDVL